MLPAILSNMLWLRLEHLTAAELRDAKSMLTITPKVFESGGEREEVKPIVTYVIDQRTRSLGVPAFWGIRVCRSKGIPIKEETTTGQYIAVPKCPKPWDQIAGQDEFFEEVLAALKERNIVLAEAGTGTGKTATAMYGIAKLRCATAVVVPTAAAADHWREEFVKHNGFKPEHIGMIGDGECRWENCPVVVMILNSAAEKELPPEFFARFGMVIFDEAHRLGARTFNRAMPRFHCKYRLWLTATPDRKDGCMEIVTNYSGKACAILGGEPMPCNVHTERYQRRFWGRTDPNSLPPAVLINILSKDQERNAVLARRIALMHAKGRQVMGIGHRLEQLTAIRDMLVNVHRIPAAKIGIFAGAEVTGRGKNKKSAEIDADERARVRRECEIILGTAGSLKESVDVPRMDAGLELTPFADAVQLIGRVRRPMKGKKIPVWFTLLDEGIPMLRNFHRKRCRDWEAVGCTIISS